MNPTTMWNKFRLIVVALIMTIFLSAAHSQTLQTKTSADSTVQEKTPFFVPNPQVIAKRKVKHMPLGEKAPDFNLPGVDGKFHKLSDYDGSKLLMISFTCNHCPAAQSYQDETMRIVNDYDIKDLQVVCISANSPLGLTLDELGHSDMGDDYEWMVVRAKEKGYNFPYLYDGDTHEASLKYGPAYTPHVFLFDKDRKLRYIGRLDNFENPGHGDGKTIRDAIDTLLAGGTIYKPIRKNFGCPIKWSWKNELRIKDNEAWAKKPVHLKELNYDELDALLKNKSKKLRLINFWATWCGPCTKEFPSLIEMHRIYSRYAFELITVSVDTPSKKDRALAFLESQNAAVTNYIYNGGDRENLINRVNPDWDGSIPLSILVEPGGKIVGYWNGAIDPYTVKKAIVDNKYMGRY